MKRSVPVWTALLLGGCGFPYTPRALPPANAPAIDAAPAAAAYTPLRQFELAGAGQRRSAGLDTAIAPLPGPPLRTRYGANTTPFQPLPNR